MAYPKSKEEYFDRVKAILEKHNYTINPYRQIQYGMQFIVFKGTITGIIRIFDGKKGLRLDLSQVKDDGLRENITNLLKPLEMERGRLLRFESKQMDKVEDVVKKPANDPDEIIGVDESGKGDYFGPLVISAVYSNITLGKKFQEMGVGDSKKIKDEKIRELAPLIKEMAAHSIIVLANKSYNEVYEKVGNLNHMLAWGHANCIETVLDQVHCNYALSDDFGAPQLIKAQLFSKGKPITLISRPRAEENIAVAAASILARATFLEYMDEISENMKTTMPKGAGPKVIETAQELVNKHGFDILPFVAKVHFKTTDSLSEPN